MRKRNKRKNKIIIFIIFITLILSLFYFFINDKVKNNIILENINDISANVFNASSFSFFKNDNNYNLDVKNEINNDYKKEIESLKKVLDLNKVNSDKNIINASVIKRNINYWYNTITINKGKKDNIKIGDAVINSNGLIGKVININKHTSDVKLLISLNDDNYISAKFSYDNNDYYGLIEKYDFKNNELILKDVIGTFDKEKIKDINVVTSGLSDTYSSGLLIGKIKDIKTDSLGLSNNFILTPTVNFDNIDIVSIVVGDKK